MTGQRRSSEPTTLYTPPTPQLSLSVRAAAQTDGGTFEGYACLWDVLDAYGTRFAPMCFGAGGLDADLYALLNMHDPTAVIGTFTAKEDSTGLWIAGGWDSTPEGQAARARAASGSAPELSVGFVALMLDPDDEDRFTQARLVEVSQITRRMAAVPGAAFASVRASTPRGRPGEEGNDNPGEGRLGDGEEHNADDEQRGAAAIASVILALSKPVPRR